MARSDASRTARSAFSSGTRAEVNEGGSLQTAIITLPDSTKFWVYKFKAPYKALVCNLKAHSSLANWTVEDKGIVPMDFVAPDRQIHDHLKRLQAKGEIDLDHHDPTAFFSPEKRVSSLSSWVTAMDVKYAAENMSHTVEW